MLDSVRKYVRERFGRIAPKRTEELTRTLVKQGQATAEQAARIARDLREWSRKNREMATEIVQREVRQQVARLAVATKEEIAAIRDRVRDLERRGGRKRTAKKTTAKRATAKRAPAKKKTAAKKAAAKKPAAKRTAARKTARPAKRA